MEALRVLLDDLSEAAVVVIHHAHLPLANVPAWIHLQELEQTDALALIRRLAEAQFRGRDALFSDDEIWHVWNVAGGNPGAIYDGIHAVQWEPVS
jgi:hypothetical protein